jgi:integrase
VRQARDAFRYLLRWLATTCPEVTSLDQLTREHLETYLGWLHDYLNPRSGQPLAVQTRYTYLSPLLQFFRETSDWGWDGVPARRLLSRSDLPKLPVRLPRYIPRDQLDPLMAAVEQLPDPYQRTALLLLRWSGARRGEIARLTLDCLDAYPDGHPRLRIPVGKTYTERSVPLHPEAANALRELIAHVRGTETVAWQDHTALAGPTGPTRLCAGSRSRSSSSVLTRGPAGAGPYRKTGSRSPSVAPLITSGPSASSSPTSPPTTRTSSDWC